MDVHAAYGIFLRHFRRRRMREFARVFDPRPETAILDVGGSAFNWEILDAPGRVTLLNLSAPAEPERLPAHVDWTVGDGTALDYADGSFDVAFSNSVIEHLGSWERQEAFARELRRVGRGLWVQTPARGFPVEPHLMTPCVHYLPRAWQRCVLRDGTVWGWLARPSREQVDRFLDETRLLDYGQMRALFPDCEIRRERFLGLTKSYVALRAPTAPLR